MNIYTKTGDKGETSLFDNKRVSKDDIRVESYGTIDELGSLIGLSKHYVLDAEMYNILEDIQNKLFTVASNLATEDQTKIKHHIVEEDISNLEKIVDYYMGRLDNPKGFIITGTSKASAYIHLARTVCRRGERRIISLAKVAEINPLVVKYINRLSDTLYAMARFLEEEQVEVKY